MPEYPWIDEELRFGYDEAEFYGDEELDDEPDYEFYDT